MIYYSLTYAARRLTSAGLPTTRAQLVMWLLHHDWCYRGPSGRLTPYTSTIQEGLMDSKRKMVRDGRLAVDATVVTDMGLVTIKQALRAALAESEDAA